MCISPAKDPFIQHIDALLSDERYPAFDFHQRLQLHFHGSHMHLKDETIEMKKVDKISPQRILGWLPLLSKISLLFTRMGISAAHKALQPTAEIPNSPVPALTDSDCAEAAAFGEQIEAEIDGVVTIYELDALRILRMRLFAALDRSLQRGDDLLNIPIKKMVDQNITDSTVKNELEIVRAFLIRMFGYIQDYQYPHYLGGAEWSANEVLKMLATLPDTWKHKPESVDKHKLNEDIECLQHQLTLMQRALKKPYVLFPLLLNRIRSIPKVSCALPADKEAIDPSASSWLSDAVDSWEIQSKAFLPLLKTINSENAKICKKVQKLEETRKDLINEAKKSINPAISRALKELHDFEQLPTDRQLNSLGNLAQLKTTCESLGKEYEAFSQRMQQFTKGVQELIPLNQGQLPDNETFPHYDKLSRVQLPVKVEEEINTPQYCYFRLTSAIIDSIEARCKLYKRFYKIIGEVMTPIYKHLSGVPLVDLLQWQLRAHYEATREKLSNNQIKERLEMHQVRTDIIFAYTRQLLTAQHLDHDLKAFAHFEWTTRASEIARDAQEDLQHAPEIVKPLLQYYVGFGDVLGHFLLFRKAHKMLTRNPYQQEHPPELEEKFYCGVFGMIRSMFLSQRPEMLTEKLNSLLVDIKEQEKSFIDPVKDLVNAYRGLSKLQDKFRQQPSPTLATFKQQARQFLDQLIAYTKDLERRSEEIGLSLSVYLADAKDPSGNIKEMAEALPHTLELLQLFIFSPAQRLISYLAIDEIITEEKADADLRQKRASERIDRKKARSKIPFKTAEPDAISPITTSLTVAQPSPINSLQNTFQLLEQRYRVLIHGNKSEIAQTLLHNLTLLKNLCATVDRHGERPSFILECNLALAVHLEQTLTLLQQPGNSKSSTSKSQEVLKSMGMEYRWNQHAPHLMVPADKLDKPVLRFLEEKEKVIAVSSRYPATGRDQLSKSVMLSCTQEKGLPQALLEKMRDRCRILAKDNLQAGLEACIALLDTFGPKLSNAPMEEPLSPLELESALAPPASAPMFDENSIRATLARFENLLERIQKFRSVSLYREIEDPRNNTQRKGTIREALKELQLLPSLCRDLLLAPEVPSQGFIQAKQAWLRQAVLLESVLLIILSHLPAFSQNPQTHCLWEEPNPARYQHRLIALTKLLRSSAFPASLLDETEEIAKEAEPFLRKLYRYHSQDSSPTQDRLIKMRNLMRLRAQLQEGLQGWPQAQIRQLDRLLDISQDTQRAARLDAHILAVLKSDAKIPLLETVEVVEEWLRIYEKLLIQTATRCK